MAFVEQTNSPPIPVFLFCLCLCVSRSLRKKITKNQACIGKYPCILSASRFVCSGVSEGGDALYLIALNGFSLGTFEFIYTFSTHSVLWQAAPQLNLLLRAEKSL